MSRPAVVADKLITTTFPGTITRGFAEEGGRGECICLLPGTEIAFLDTVRFYAEETYHPVLAAARVARFRQINTDNAYAHHDALEFPDGQIVLVTRLCEGQHATVLQLPAEPVPEKAEPPAEGISRAGLVTGALLS